MEENNKPKQITNFDELIQMYKYYIIELKDRDRESYWLRYLFRRISLFGGFGFVFFGVCLVLALIDGFGVDVINKVIEDLRWFDADCRNEILIISVGMLFLRSILPWRWFVEDEKARRKRKSENEELNIEHDSARKEGCSGKDHNDIKRNGQSCREVWSEFLEKPIAFLLIISAFLSGFSWVISQDQALLLGLIFFSVITLGGLLADRTLGFTRRNERYRLFANRAEGLIVESRSRKAILDKSGNNIQFNEEHLLDCSAFFEELRQDKHNATMSDSFYVLRLKERLLRATTA